MIGLVSRRLRAETARDAGVTLIELLVVMLLMSIISGIIVVAMTSIYRVQRGTNHEAAGLADVRTVVERLGRDLRDARAVDPGADASHLVLWIDYNSDYIRDPVNQKDEIVTWSLCGPTDSGCPVVTGSHYNVLRQTSAGTVKQEARTLVSNIAFCYSKDVSTDPPTCLPTPLSTTDAADAKVVTVTVTYNADPNADPSSPASTAKNRTTTFTERLRNVP